MQLQGRQRTVTGQVLTGAVVAVLAAVGAHALGVQQLLRIPGLALYLPAGIVGGSIGATRLRPLLWILAAPIAFTCLVVAYTPLLSVLAEPRVRRDRIPDRVDAIAVLSGGLTPDGRLRSGSLDRVLSGRSLARDGLARAMIVSRERRVFGGRSVSDSADLQEALADSGPDVEIVFVDSVFTTRTEALRMLPIARARGWSTLAVVTSPLHTARACATFEAVGFKVVCVPAASREHVVPSASNPEDRLRVFRSWLYETFASAEYRSNGWIR